MKNYQQKAVEPEHSYELKAEPVSKYMTRERDLITFTRDTPIIDVINSLLEHRITGAPVLNEKKEVVGLIDDKDCLHMLVDSAYHNQPLSKATVESYMSNVMKTIPMDSDIVDVANIFLTTPFKRLLVLDEDGKLSGQISRRDILQAVHGVKAATWHKAG